MSLIKNMHINETKINIKTWLRMSYNQLCIKYMKNVAFITYYDSCKNFIKTNYIIFNKVDKYVRFNNEFNKIVKVFYMFR